MDEREFKMFMRTGYGKKWIMKEAAFKWFWTTITNLHAYIYVLRIDWMAEGKNFDCIDWTKPKKIWWIKEKNMQNPFARELLFQYVMSRRKCQSECVYPDKTYMLRYRNINGARFYTIYIMSESKVRSDGTMDREITFAGAGRYDGGCVCFQIQNEPEESRISYLAAIDACAKFFPFDENDCPSLAKFRARKNE